MSACPAEQGFQDEIGTAAHECGLIEGHEGPHACAACGSTWNDAMSDSPTASTLLASGDLEARDDRA